MLIIFLVTGYAGVRRGYFPPHRLSMAVVTIQPFMPSIEFEACAGVMVEIPKFPIA